jgi:hypothetical protein
MSKEGVEMRLCAELEYMSVVGVINMGENAKKLAVDVFYS